MTEAYFFLNYYCIWFVKYLFSIDGDIRNNLLMLANNFTLCDIYRSNQPLWKTHPLNQLISISLQLKNQIKKKFPAKSCGARVIFLKEIFLNLRWLLITKKYLFHNG